MASFEDESRQRLDATYARPDIQQVIESARAGQLPKSVAGLVCDWLQAAQKRKIELLPEHTELLQ